MGCGPSKAATKVGIDSSTAYADDEPVKHIPTTLKGVENDYRIMSHLGSGSFAEVYSGVHKRTGERVAIKELSRLNSKVSSIDRENSVLEHIKVHPHVVQFKRTYKTPKSVFFVTELMSGGDLFRKLVQWKTLPETLSRAIFQQIASGVAYLHSRGIVHRDLKLENILFKENDTTSDVKICDFGLSQVIKKNQKLLKICGTWAYAAPEMIDRSRPGYDTSFDCWSFGVMCFLVLSGYHPFDPSGNLPGSEIRKRMRQGMYDFQASVWEFKTDLAKDLISRLLVVDPQKRATMIDILHHPWIAEAYPLSMLSCKDGEIIIDESKEMIYPPGIHTAFTSSRPMVTSCSVPFSSLSEASLNQLHGESQSTKDTGYEDAGCPRTLRLSDGRISNGIPQAISSLSQLSNR